MIDNDDSPVVEWTPSFMLEVSLRNPEDFLKVRETLTRIGVASRKTVPPTLIQSCFILHKQGKYFLTHFKEMFLLDGNPSKLTQNDLQRRNTIATLLSDWGLIAILHPENFRDEAPISQIKIIPFKEKELWTLTAKYAIGRCRGSANKTTA